MENGPDTEQGGVQGENEPRVEAQTSPPVDQSVLEGPGPQAPVNQGTPGTGDGESGGNDGPTSAATQDVGRESAAQGDTEPEGPESRTQHPSGDELPISPTQFAFVEQCMGALKCYPLHPATRELPSGEVAALSLSYFQREPIGTLKIGRHLCIVEYNTPAARDEVARYIENTASFTFKGGKYSLTLRRPESPETSLYVNMACGHIMSEIVWTIQRPSPHEWVNRVHDTYMRYEEGYDSYATIQGSVVEQPAEGRRVTMHGQLDQTPRKGPVAKIGQGAQHQTTIWGPENTVTELLKKMARDMAELRCEHAQLKVEYQHVKESLKEKEKGQLTAMDEDGIIDTSGSVERQKQLKAAIETAVTNAVQGAMQGLVQSTTEAPTVPATQRVVHPQSASTPTGQGRHFPALQGNWMGTARTGDQQLSAPPPRYIAPQSNQSSPVVAPPANHTIYPVAQYTAPAKITLPGQGLKFNLLVSIR